MLTITEIKRKNKAIGHHWFSPASMRFFNSRVARFVCQDQNNTDIYYFISSEQFDHNHPRLYSVRSFDYVTGKVDTVGEFQQYQTLAQAKAAAKRIAKGETNETTN